MINKNTLHRRRGAFSLVELMTVISIIAILAVISIPSYKGYLKRQAVNEVFALTDQVKLKITEYYVNTGTMPNAQDIGMSSSGVDLTSSYYSFYSQLRLVSLTKAGANCSKPEGCSDLVLYFDQGELGTAHEIQLWIRYYPDGDSILADCGVDNTTFGDDVLEYIPVNCQKLSANHGG